VVLNWQVRLKEMSSRTSSRWNCRTIRQMVTLDSLRSGLREEILLLAQRRGARNLRVFGSVARGEANE
jgi:hypothetical protein